MTEAFKVGDWVKVSDRAFKHPFERYMLLRNEWEISHHIGIILKITDRPSGVWLTPKCNSEKVNLIHSNSHINISLSEPVDCEFLEKIQQIGDIVRISDQAFKDSYIFRINEFEAVARTATLISQPPDGKGWFVVSGIHPEYFGKSSQEIYNDYNQEVEFFASHYLIYQGAY